ncbi:hypothetical protein PHYC_03513 [Phycisphaerales bacterium]|nr:hypothetical protein PHYC_03513 [Phycisphaerales bacterium]
MLEQLLQFLGRVHPLVLHLPIGLVGGLAACELIALVRRKPIDPPLRRTLAWLAAASAALAAASGLFLSREDAYSGQTLDLHLWLGVSTAAGTLCAAALLSRGMHRPYAVLLILSTAVMLPTGHLGGTMTHGEDFLFEPFRDAAPHVEPASPGVSMYRAQVAPILAARCANCHGGTRHKAGLRLNSPEGILAGGDSGSAIEPGDVENSEILVRLKLPPDDSDHMPPKQKGQPTAEEIAIIERWIAEGARFDGGEPVPVVAEAAPAPPPPPARAQPPADALERLRAAQVHVEVADPQTGLFWVSFGAAAGTTDAEAAALLTPLKDCIADLSLARTATGDATLGVIAGMTELRTLDMSGTAVTPAGIGSLQALANLEELRLTRTRLDDQAVEAIRSLTPLKRLFVWNAGVSEPALQSLRAARPDLAINAGAEPAEPVGVEPEFALTSTAPVPGTVTPAMLEPVNAVCPVSGAPVDLKYLVVNENRVVGFCCEKCAAKFLVEPTKFTVKAR